MSVFDEVYSGVGVTKLEAKINAAAYAVDVLQRNGVITAREKELKAEQREANWLKRHAEGPPEIPRYDHRMFGEFEFATSLSIFNFQMYRGG